MSILSTFIQKFFGSKSERDIKEVQPYVTKILEEYDKLQYISNDELRALRY
jgi:preprotein translocase subunit SecA